MSIAQLLFERSHASLVHARRVSMECWVLAGEWRWLVVDGDGGCWAVVAVAATAVCWVGLVCLTCVPCVSLCVRPTD